VRVVLIGLFWLAWGAALAMGTSPQQAAGPGEAAARPEGVASVMLRDDDLRTAPSASASVVKRLAKGASVRVVASEGGWTRIAAGGASGWVRVLSVRQGAQGGADLAGLVEAGTTARDPGRVVAVAGVRGLDEAVLKAASFNAAELQLLGGYALGRAEAEQFAQAAGLRASALPYLPSPGAAANNASWKGNEP
jgi:hypothetical protein